MEYATIQEAWAHEIYPSFHQEHQNMQYIRDNTSDSDSDSDSDSELDAWICTKIQSHLKKCPACRAKHTQKQKKKQKQKQKQKQKSLKETFVALNETGLFVSLMVIVVLMLLDMYVSFLQKR